MPVELWYLGVERKMPGFEVEDTRTSLQWEAIGEARKLIVTIETNKRSETFQIDIDDLELWAVSPETVLIHGSYALRRTSKKDAAPCSY